MQTREPIGHIVKRILDENPTRSLDSISAELQFSAKYLSRAFNEQCGFHFRKYRLKKTEELAKDLLLNTTKRLFEIAPLVGYSSAERFINSFKKMTGKTPHIFRTEHGVSIPAKLGKTDRLKHYRLLATSRYLRECKENFKADKDTICKYLPKQEQARFLRFVENNKITFDQE